MADPDHVGVGELPRLVPARRSSRSAASPSGRRLDGDRTAAPWRPVLVGVGRHRARRREPARARAAALPGRPPRPHGGPAQRRRVAVTRLRHQLRPAVPRPGRGGGRWSWSGAPPTERRVPLVVFVAAALLGARNIPIASIVLVPGLARGPGGPRSPRRPRAGARPGGGSAWWSAMAGVVATVSSLGRPAYDLGTYPVAAIAWLDERGALTRDGRVATSDVVGNLPRAARRRRRLGLLRRSLRHVPDRSVVEGLPGAQPGRRRLGRGARRYGVRVPAVASQRAAVRRWCGRSRGLVACPYEDDDVIVACRRGVALATAEPPRRPWCSRRRRPVDASRRAGAVAARRRGSRRGDSTARRRGRSGRALESGAQRTARSACTGPAERRRRPTRRGGAPSSRSLRRSIRVRRSAACLLLQFDDRRRTAQSILRVAASAEELHGGQAHDDDQRDQHGVLDEVGPVVSGEAAGALPRSLYLAHGSIPSSLVPENE